MLASPLAPGRPRIETIDAKFSVLLSTTLSSPEIPPRPIPLIPVLVGSITTGKPSPSTEPSDCTQGILRLQDSSPRFGDRKSTRLNSSHVAISYAVFCLKR